jgi:hypothetical protein
MGKADVPRGRRQPLKEMGIADSRRRPMGRADVLGSSHPSEAHKVALIDSEAPRLRPSLVDESSIHIAMAANGKLDNTARLRIFPSPAWMPGSLKEDA